MQHFALPLLFFAFFCSSCHAIGKPGLLLANKFHANIQLDDYWVSEKYDGIRAYWNGKQLISRNGHAFAAPPWFVKDFPAEPLDGELWLGHARFEQLSSIVKTESNAHKNWESVRYMVFDLPASTLPFNQRLQHLYILLGKPDSPYIQLVKQWKVDSFGQLQQQLLHVVANGGEGLMLHSGTSLYEGERSDDLLKLKPFDDAEAIVVQHFNGQGKFTHMMGSMEVVNSSGQHFRIGTGFNDTERKNPPPVGTTITYRYNGLTRKGLPRFPRFLRVRNEW